MLEESVQSALDVAAVGVGAVASYGVSGACVKTVVGAMCAAEQLVLVLLVSIQF